MRLNETGNENWQLGRDLPLSVVDKLADELAAEYDNMQFRGWYCGAIRDLGIARITEIRSRVKEAKHPGKLFSFYVKQERTALKNKWLLDQKRRSIGGLS